MTGSIFRKILSVSLVVLTACALTSCDKEDGPAPVLTRGFFLSVTGSNGTEYVMLVEDVDEGTAHISSNFQQMKGASNYTWIFNSDPSVAFGLIYQQGDPAPCYGFNVDAGGKVQTLGEVSIEGGYGTYGFVGNYVVTGRSGTTPVDSDGNALLYESGVERKDGVTFNLIDIRSGSFGRSSKTILTNNIAGNGEQATLSGIVDLGDGTFLSSLVLSQPITESTGGNTTGPVTYPDSCWVGLFDLDFNVKKIYRSDKQSYSSGRYRSQYYSQIGIADDGYIYVFSGAYNYAETSHKSGALRIRKGADDFDPGYHFVIDRYFRRVWHITGSYFLLELYNEGVVPSATATAVTTYAIADMANRKVTSIANFPSPDAITATGLPMPYNGKMYFPVTAEGVAGGYGTIYVIDPATATATPGLTVTGATSINAVGRMTDK